MKTALAGAIMLLLANLCSAAPATPRPHLTISAESSPPSAMMGNGRVIGFATDKIRGIMERVGIDYRIELLPWKRAYLLAQTQPDTCVYSTTRVPERETQFKWIGPTHENDWTLFARADRNYHIASIEEARKYRIGATNGDIRSETLDAQGYLIDNVQDRLSNPRKLLVDRIDLWVSSLRVGSAIIAENGWSKQIVPVLTFRRTELYLACNIGVPDALVVKMNAALRSMNSEGVSAAIERKYNVVYPALKN
jgi:polar amino acid transport system substrate-binding protein